ncbi:hypothetical protein F2Q68_00000713 [Brassica cretica]|uniref:BRX domain-containing protein n=1 Tax=Brassica cretica TaxID=69181 RepID=A0A8S9JLG0_BRACR|nr:hypothetical protein F2Q68_00000713 [Brassica cretica]
MFNKLQAQRWWADNYDKVKELYNVQKLSRNAFPLPTPPRSEDEAKVEYHHPEDTPATPPLNKERLPRTVHRPVGLAAYSSSDSLDHSSTQSQQFHDSGLQNSTPKLSSISGAKTETSSMDSSSRDADRSEEMSVSNASDVDPNEWVEQDEPGVYITIKVLPNGKRELRRPADNYDKVKELYNVQKLSRNAFPLPTPPRSEDEAKVEYHHPEDTPATPPLNKERLPRTVHRPVGLAAYSSSDSLDHSSTQSQQFHDSGLQNSTPKLSSISGTKTETSSMDSSSRDADRSEEMSVSNASDVDPNEWVEQDEPGVYITIKVLPNGKRELRRVRFSREIFGEMQARVWWEENRARIHEHYL